MNDRDLLLIAGALVRGLVPESQVLAYIENPIPLSTDADDTTLPDEWAVLGEEHRELKIFLAQRAHEEGVSESQLAQQLAVKALMLAIKSVRQPRLVQFLAREHARLRGLTKEDSADSRPNGGRDGFSATTQYRWQSLLGQGGLGTVWSVLDNFLGREIAVKRLHAGLRDHPEARQRFQSEARITGSLEHPHIVPVFQAGVNDSHELFYAMRLVRGQTLTQTIESYHKERQKGSDPQLELFRLLGIFTQVCQAVAYAHSRGIIHRDLKPDNIIVGHFGEVFVVDWGLAKDVGESGQLRALGAEGGIVVRMPPPSLGRGSSEEMALTGMGQIVGTPAWMSPEQATGAVDRIDRSTDIYLLGGILFAILCNKSPHGHASSRSELLSEITNNPTPSVRRHRPDVSLALHSVVCKAMAGPQSARYQSASQLAEDVERWMAGDAVAAYRDPLRLRLARWVQRHPTLAMTLGLSLVFLVSIISGGAAMVAFQDEGLYSHQQSELMTQMKLFSQIVGFHFRHMPNGAWLDGNAALVNGLVDPPPTMSESEQQQLRNRFALNCEGVALGFFAVQSIAIISAETGQERVRVERKTATDPFAVIPQDQLINVRNMPYFAKGLAIPRLHSISMIANLPPTSEGSANRGLVAVSPIYLEDSPKPVALLSIMVNFNLIFNLGLERQPFRYAYLADADGRLLFNPYVAGSGAPILPPNDSVVSVFPILKGYFDNPDQSNVYLPGGPFQDWIVLAQRLPYDTNPDNSISLIGTYSRKGIFGQVETKLMIAVLLGLAVFAALLSFLFAFLYTAKRAVNRR